MTSYAFNFFHFLFTGMLSYHVQPERMLKACYCVLMQRKSLLNRKALLVSLTNCSVVKTLVLQMWLNEPYPPTS